MKYHHSIDDTNGYDVDEQGTFPAPKISDRWDDKWMVDHYGNKYAIKMLIYRPDSPEWKLIDDGQ